jgi:Na+/H+-translocating membrane pyrophosphatase
MIYDLSLIIITYFINVVLYFITFSWIIMMEKQDCECSVDWRRDFIKYYLICVIVFIIASFAHIFFLNNRYHKIFDSLRYIFLLSEIVFVTVVFLYIRDLIKKRCECSAGMERDVTLIYSVVDGVLIIATIILFIGALIAGADT